MVMANNTTEIFQGIHNISNLSNITNASQTQNVLLSTHSSSDVKETWWTVVAIISGFCFPLLIFWISIKILEFRRYGYKCDIFHEDESPVDLLASRDINFLFNKAVVGAQYNKKPPEVKQHIPKRSKGLRDNLGKAVSSIAKKFELKIKKKRRRRIDGAEELEPIKTKIKKKPKSYRCTSLTYRGGVVSIPLTRTTFGRARPLPQPPCADSTESLA